MDQSKISPQDLATGYMDSSFNVEGREEYLHEIRERYPEETKSEADKIAEQIFDPNSEGNQNLMSTAKAFSANVPDLGINTEGMQDLPGAYEQQPPAQPQPTTPGVGEEYRQFSDREKLAFNTDLAWDPYELEVAAKLKSNNLEDTVEAFNEINASPELTAKFDTNGDGEFTYADMYDTHRWNNGEGITEEQDAEFTARWLNAREKKNFAARLGHLGQNFPGVMNKTEFMIEGRRARLGPKEEAQASDDNIVSGLLESAVGTLNFPQAAAHFVSGGKIGGEQGNRLGDQIFGTSNPKSMAYLMMTPAKRSWSDGLWHEVGYWGSEALQIGLTMGAGAKVTASKQVMNLPKGKRLAMAANKFFTQHPGTTKKVVKTWTKTGIKETLISPTGPASKFFIPQAKNAVFSLGKAGIIETSKGAFTRDLTLATVNGVYTENTTAKKFIDKHASGWAIGAQMVWAIETPMGKRFAYWADEAATDTAFAGGLMTIFRGGKFVVVKGGGPALKWSAKTTEPLRTSVVKRFWNGHPINQRTGKDYWNIRQQKGEDGARAGKEQLGKNIDPENVFNEGDTPLARQNTQGRYKNIDSNANPGEGIVPTRDTPTQILNDADENAGQIFGGMKGTTSAALDPTDLAIAAKHGPNGPIYKKLTNDFVGDPKYKAQLDSIDPASRTVGDYGEGSIKRLMEIMEGRDAGNLSPEEYWPKEFLDQRLKAGSIEELDELQKYMAEKLFVADSINSSLLAQLRDKAAAAGDMLGKQDIFTTDGVMSNIAKNLSAGLSNVKQTRLRWSLLGERLKAADGKLNKGMIDEVESIVSARTLDLHDETVDGVRLMMDLLKKSDAPELVDGLLDVFKVANDIHNWKDFDAWMRQKITGGEFKGKVKTGVLIRELQGVMVNSILSGPKTPLRAILGTTTNAYLNAFNEYAGAVLRSPFNKDLIARKASAAKLKGMIEILPEAWHVFKENWNAKFTADFATIRTRYSEAPTRGDHNWNLFKTWTEANGTDGDKAALYLANTARTLNNNKLLSWSPRALAATDDTFKWLLARARSKEVGMRQALEATGEDWAKFDANLFKKAEEAHYRNLLDNDGNLDLSNDSWLNKQFKEITLTSELDGFSKKLDGLLNETPLLKPFYLFARTGLNGLNLSLKNTPLLGALHKESIDILRHSGDDFTPLMKYGIENANDLANARNLFAGRQAVGATVVTGISGMYIAGQLTGNGPADRELKQSWINGGWKPNHIYIGDVGFNYTSLEPFNVIFSSIADIGDNMELMGTEWAEKRLQAVAFVLGRGLTSKTYMSGLDQLMQVVQMKPGALDKAGANILNNSIPLAGMRNEFGKWINPYMKELNSDMWSSIRNRNQLSEFAAGKPLAVKHDILNGKPINNWNIFGRSFNAISPVSMDIRRDTPGRRLLQESNYDLKTTTYSYGGYSFAQDANVRSAFQKEIGSASIEFRGKKFNNLEQALDYVSTLPDVEASVAKMKASVNNPALWDVDPTDYPHNTIIDNLVNQARSKAWAALNTKTHPKYPLIQQLKAEKDGLDSKTRDVRKEILELSYPTTEFEQFPKKN